MQYSGSFHFSIPHYKRGLALEAPNFQPAHPQDHEVSPNESKQGGPLRKRRGKLVGGRGVISRIHTIYKFAKVLRPCLGVSTTLSRVAIISVGFLWGHYGGPVSVSTNDDDLWYSVIPESPELSRYLGHLGPCLMFRINLSLLFLSKWRILYTQDVWHAEHTGV